MQRCSISRFFLLTALLISLAGQSDRPTIADPTATVVVNGSSAIGVVPATAYGVNTMFYDPELMDTAVPNLLKPGTGLGITALRYPGGTNSDTYDFANNTTTTTHAAGIAANNFDGFMTNLAIPVGASPIITANYGTSFAGTGGGIPSEAASWVTYANITKHYGVKYWEIGNEIYGNGFYGTGQNWEPDLHFNSTTNRTGNVNLSPTTYGQNVALYSQAMKAVDPTVKIGVVMMGPRIFSAAQMSDWNTKVLAACGTSIDFVIIHYYPQNAGTENDANLLSFPAGDIGPFIQNTLRPLIAADCGANAPNVQIFVTETNSVSSSFAKQTESIVNALYLADDYATWLENGASSVNWWNLHSTGIGVTGNFSASLFGTEEWGNGGILANGKTGFNSVVGAQETEPAADTPLKTYFAMQMLATYNGRPGDMMVTSSSSTGLLAVHAARRSTGDLTFLLINRDPANTCTTTVSLNGFTPGTTATTRSFGVGSTSLATGTIPVTGNTVTVTLPFYSMTVVDVPAGVITPVTTASLAGTTGTNGWFTGPSTVTLSATDTGGPGVASTFFTIDGAAQQTYSAPFTVSGDGTHTLAYWSVDTSGTTETQHSQTVKIDGTAPTLAFGAQTPAANANGWNDSAVSIPFTDADATSGVASTTLGSPLQFSSAGANQTLTVGVTDNAGNSASFVSQAVSIDLTAPTSSATTSGSNPTTVTISATDALSGVASTFYTVDGGTQQTYTAPFAVSGGGSHTVSYWSTDKAGNVETADTLSFAVDVTPPVTTAGLVGTFGGGNWYATSVTVTLTATDAGSGVASTFYTLDGGAAQTYTAPFTVSGDGQHSLTFWSVDNAGNIETTRLNTIKIDGTPPTVTFGAQSPAANANGWNNSAVSIPYTASDATSGLATSTPGSPLTFSAAGANQTQTVVAKDIAGNHASFVSPAVNIDLVAPTSSATTSGTSTVTVTITATDDLSGVASTFYTIDGGAQQTYTAPFAISAGGSHTVSYWSVDKAGNVETAHTLSISIDVTPPVTTAAKAGTLGNNGWYTSAVTVTLTATDDLSGVASTVYNIDGGAQQTYSAPFTVSGDSQHVVNYHSVDNAGNVETSHILSVIIDGTPPTLTFGAQSPAANANGWNNTAVSIPYTAADGMSGLASSLPGSPLTFSSAGANQTQTVVATDNAGNAASFASASVNIDLAAPSSSATTSGTSTVTVTLSATDDLSGVASTFYTIDGGAQQTYTAPFTVSGGGSHTVSYWSVDKAGNIETAHTLNLSIDVTPPVTTAGLAGTAGSNGWFTSAVTVTLTATDAGSGIASTTYTIDGGAQQTYSAPLTVSGDAQHTITYGSVDNAGNVETPHSQTIKIDGTLPSITFGSPTPAANAAGWNKSAVSIPYTATDATSGVATSTPGSPLTFSSAGASQTQSVTLTDNAGNSKAFTSPTVKIDLTAPTTTSSVSGAVVTLTATDSLSGVASKFYTIDGGATQTYTAPFTVTGAATHTIVYWSVDVAGNVETSHTITLTINPVPVLTSMSPTTAFANGPPFTLTVNGTGFLPSSVVDWTGPNHVTPLTTTFVSATQLTAAVPTTDFTTVVKPAVTVVNPGPGGGTSNVLTFTINSNPLPTVSSISPTSVLSGSGAATITVTGTNFVPASVVKTSGTAIATTYVSSTTLTAVVPATLTAGPTSVGITVTNPTPGGGTSTPSVTFTVLPPTVSTLTLSPTSVKGGVSSTGTITLNIPAITGGTSVALSSNNAHATVQASTRVPAGSRTQTFTVTTTAVTSTTSVTITATTGTTSRTATLTITP